MRSQLRFCDLACPDQVCIRRVMHLNRQNFFGGGGGAKTDGYCIKQLLSMCGLVRPFGELNNLSFSEVS